MSTLGEILSDLNDREVVFSLLAEGGDITAIACINEAANASGRDPSDLAMDAVEAFTLKADDETWVKLIGRIQNAASPGGACLSEIITWSLERQVQDP